MLGSSLVSVGVTFWASWAYWGLLGEMYALLWNAYGISCVFEVAKMRLKNGPKGRPGGQQRTTVVGSTAVAPVGRGTVWFFEPQVCGMDRIPSI
jgi:hypothetical protein